MHAKGMLFGHNFFFELYEHFDMNTHHLGHMTKLKQSRTVEYFIVSFENLSFRREGMTNYFFWECFICDLKDEI
jgi:hypothetical protein